MSVERSRSGQGWASLAIAALAAVLVIVGLALGGGPIQARKERRDEVRLDDLNRLSVHISCLSRLGDRIVMPADLSETEGCPGPVRRADPYSGAEYRVEPLAKGRYRLCAEFELPPQVPNAGWPGEMGNRDGDCIVHELPRIADRQFGNEPAG